MKIIIVKSKKFGDKETMVDDADYEWLNSFKWFLSKSNGGFYVRRKIGGNKTITMHRQILGITDSKIKGDHIDINPLNNQRGNLRTATPKQSSRNRAKVNGNSSKYLGVCWSRHKFRWRATIFYGKQIYLGVFKSEEEAALAYDKKALELFGEFANLNFKIAA